MVDCKKDTQVYRQNIQLIKNNHIKYIARIVVFPDGGTDEQVLSEDYWSDKYRLADLAIHLGAQEIQLDYVRYRADHESSMQNEQNIYHVIHGE